VAVSSTCGRSHGYFLIFLFTFLYRATKSSFEALVHEVEGAHDGSLSIEGTRSSLNVCFGHVANAIVFEIVL
jgi:hypothetical protein